MAWNVAWGLQYPINKRGRKKKGDKKMTWLEPEIEFSLTQFLKQEPGTFLDEMEAWAMEDDFNTYLFTKETHHENNQSIGNGQSRKYQSQ